MNPEIAQKTRTAPGSESTLCPGCSFAEFERFMRLEDGDLLKCRRCDLVFLVPRPTAAELKAHYQQYFDSPGASPIALDRNRRELFHDCLRRIERFAPAGVLIDVGAAYGDFASMARDRGYQVFGVEIARHPCSVMEAKSIAHYCGSLEDAPFAADSVDLITFWDVLEHLPDPSSTLMAARRILRAGGLLVATVPNRRFQSFLIAAERLVGRDGTARREIPSHLNHFSAPAIRRALENSAFKVLDIQPAFPTPLQPRFTNILKSALYRVAVATHKLLRMNIGNELLVFATRQ